MLLRNISQLNVGDRFLKDEKWWTKEDEDATEWHTNARSDDGEVSWFNPSLEVEVEE